MSDPRYEGVGDPDIKCVEECAELIHAICKARRFGWDNWHPDDPTRLTNKGRVFSEISDVEKRCAELRAYLTLDKP